MEIQALSARYRVRRLEPKDTGLIYDLCCGNRLYYEYHPPFVTRESILEDMTALPPGKCAADKFYMGYFDGQSLVALMDLILGYPERDMAWIGLFMTDAHRQRRGIGSAIVREAADCLRAWGYRAIRLGVDRGNPQSEAFWTKNQFVPLCEERYRVMQRVLREGEEETEKSSV